MKQFHKKLRQLNIFIVLTLIGFLSSGLLAQGSMYNVQYCSSYEGPDGVPDFTLVPEGKCGTRLNASFLEVQNDNIVDWLDADQNPLFVAPVASNTLDVLALGLVNQLEIGITTFFAKAQNGDLYELTYEVLDCEIEVGQCAYMLRISDNLPNDGWEGDKIDVIIAGGQPETYSVSTSDCVWKFIPIIAGSGSFISLEFDNVSNSEEHTILLMDMYGETALDLNGAEIDYNGTTIPQIVKAKMNCPETCASTEEFIVEIKIGDNPARQAWELTNELGQKIAGALLGEYEGLANGTIIEIPVLLNSCKNYSFDLFEVGNSWALASLKLYDEDKLLLEANSEGNYPFAIHCPLDCGDDITIQADGDDCDVDNYTYNLPQPIACYPTTGTTIDRIELVLDGEIILSNVIADLETGIHKITTTYFYSDGQEVSCTNTISVYANDNPHYGCNSLIRIPLGMDNNGNCFTPVLPDMVAEGDLACEGEFIVEIYNNGVLIPDGNILTGDLVGLTLDYTLIHLADKGNSCDGKIEVLDNLAPMMECKSFDIECNHPHALDGNYTHISVLKPANIPGTILGDMYSNLTVEFTTDCAPLGEEIKGMSLDLDINHSRMADLFFILVAPDGNAVQAPVNELDDELFELFNGKTYADLSGVWKLQLTDFNGTVNPDSGIGNGYGQLIDATLNITAGFPNVVEAMDCSPVEIEMIEQTLIETHCDNSDWNGAKIRRTWKATDAAGNSSNCEQIIGLKKPALSDIIAPANISIPCQAGLTADDITIEDTGYPVYGCFDLVPGVVHSVCDLAITYSDVVVPTCGEGFKIIRKFTIMNWCAENSMIEFTQLIKIEDTEKPEINAENITINSDPLTCTASFSLSNVPISDCSEISGLIVTYNINGGLFDATQPFDVKDLAAGERIEDLPTGETELIIQATDACGNFSQKSIIALVEDNAAPIAICSDQHNITLGSDGTTTLKAELFGQLSYDACGEITSFEIRRNEDDCQGTTDFGAFITLECCDAGNLVEVELRVTDDQGNQAVCWKNILVEDQIAPIITAPADKTITCKELPAIFGEATAIDNCNVEISYTDSGDLNECRSGILRRTWTATDGSDKSVDATATQSINVEHISDFVVTFPDDIVLNNCPDNVDIPEPVISDDDCELIAISHEDEIATVVTDACYKIIRTYTIYNWCTIDLDANNTDLGIELPLPRSYKDDGDGYFQYTQVIKVLDTEAPQIQCAEDKIYSDQSDNCEGFVSLSVTASDNCSAADQLEYAYVLDLDVDGYTDQNGSSSSFSSILPYGNHKITWIVNDGCGNISSCDQFFTIKDDKKPTPVAISGLATVAMQGSGCVEIWANDFLKYAIDNCTEEDYLIESAKIRLAGTNDALNSGLTICCDDIQDNNTVLVEIFITDEAGNTEFVTTYIQVDDNNDVCDGLGGGSKRTISGTIETSDGVAIENVMVEVMSNAPGLPTTNSGVFTTSMYIGQDYEIIPTKENNPSQAHSTFDAIIIINSILGNPHENIQSLDNPYKLLAADVNNDKSVDILDIIELRQVILGLRTEFSGRNGWVFIDKSYKFENSYAPFNEDYPESILIENLGDNSMSNDFIGFYIGDVNGSATNLQGGSASRNDGLNLNVNDKVIEAGEIVNIDFYADNFNAYLGYQFTLKFGSDLEYVGSESRAINVNENNFGLQNIEQGLLTTSWNGFGQNVKDGEAIFSLKFKAITTVELSEALSINSRITVAEAYLGGQVTDVKLGFNSGNFNSVAPSFELFQNTPNPFKAETNIGFNLAKDGVATVKVFDLNGRTIFTQTGTFHKGYNEVNINSNSINAAGVLFYSLQSEGQTATKRMIILD